MLEVDWSIDANNETIERRDAKPLEFNFKGTVHLKLHWEKRECPTIESMTFYGSPALKLRLPKSGDIWVDDLYWIPRIEGAIKEKHVQGHVRTLLPTVSLDFLRSGKSKALWPYASGLVL